MKKFIVVVLILLVGAFLTYSYFDQSLPEGGADNEAKAMADKMLKAIGMDAWEQIPYVQWAFRGEHHYVWDKRGHRASIKWDDIEVKLDLKTQEGVTYEAGEKLSGTEAEETLQKAWEYWCNDSFWLNAPSKIYDAGTSRSVVELDNGDKGLKVTYDSGGVTPGDSYVWVLDDEGLPKYYKMWVSVIPVGGVKSTWTDWKTIEGARISTLHETGPMSITIEDLKAGDTPEEMGLAADYFEGI